MDHQRKDWLLHLSLQRCCLRKLQIHSKIHTNHPPHPQTSLHKQDTSNINTRRHNQIHRRPAGWATRRNGGWRENRGRYRFLHVFPLCFCECFQGHCFSADATSQLIRLLRSTILASTRQQNPTTNYTNAAHEGGGREIRDLTGKIRIIPILINCRQSEYAVREGVWDVRDGAAFKS